MGLEIDILIEEIPLAIELNGPCHYMNIYGSKQLRYVQNHDAVKQLELQQLGWPYIVLNTSTFNGRRKKVESFLVEQYENNIKPLLRAANDTPHG